jgi:N-6 DNA Methylase/TaqI-like C-terminal specificity domain
MPVESKPLFRPDVLSTHLRSFPPPELPEGVRQELAQWGELVGSGRIDKFKETELRPEFFQLFFHRILGYRGPSDGGQHWTISQEKHVEVEGEFADAVLGDFHDGVSPRFVVAVEVKGPKDPLDRPYGGRRLSAVDQGYRYAINLPCEWIVATSLREIRLYGKSTDQHTYESIDTEQIARDDAALKRFVYLLGAPRVVHASGECHLAALRAESEKVGRELTHAFYGRYSEMRRGMFASLSRDNPSLPRESLLSYTQRILDRVLFCAFAEDRGLLPTDSLLKAFEHKDPYHPRPTWENFRGLFAAVDRGNAGLGIHAYNGGLFSDHDPHFEALKVSDEVCAYFRDLGGYDYRLPAEAATDFSTGHALIDVDILGHIFEQSISDLEKMRGDPGILAAEPATTADRAKGRRKTEGVFYTPAFITRTIVEQALGGVLTDRYDDLRQRREAAEKGTARTALADPRVYDVDKLKGPAKAALVEFWEAWQDELTRVRVVDPACGSGAFLIEAFDQLHTLYAASNDRLRELRGRPGLFDLDKRILENNLYGVDLNAEAVEICRLSLWIKTAERGKALTSLDDTIRPGNSLIADATVHPQAFDWKAAFPRIFIDGGFDVVVGNPPYVRQELISPIKPYLQEHYVAYHGMADLYVYFYELGLRILKPGGRLSFIVTNKWMKAAYGEPLRKLLAEEAWVESVVDFGHAKQIFEDADVFPSILVARKPTSAPKPTSARLCTIPREQLRIDDLSRQITDESTALPLAQLTSDAWQLEPSGVTGLMERIRANGVPLTEYAGTVTYRGVVTGLNEAFVVDTPTRNRLVAEDPNCERLLKPCLRGQDVDRWSPGGGGQWMIVIPSSENRTWPWSSGDAGEEQIFQSSYPSIHARFTQVRDQLVKRQDKGRFWWELRSCAYWDVFTRPKIMYQEIQFHPCYAMDTSGCVMNNKVFMLPSDDLYLLGVLNSPLMWWHNWRYLPHMKDEALSPVGFLMKDLPIAVPTDEVRAAVTRSVARLLVITATQHATSATLLDWLRVEHGIEKPSQRLQGFLALHSDGFAAEVKKIRGRKAPLTAAGVKSLRDEFARTVEPAQRLAAEALRMEREVSDLVIAAYGLTPAEIDLMWETAPPRMPIPRTQP